MGWMARGPDRSGRRRATVAGALVVGLAALTASGFYRVPAPEEALVVSEWPGGIAPKLREPGISWRPPLLVRIERYPAASYDALLKYGRTGGGPLVSRDGAPLRASARLRLRPDPEGAVELHRALGAGFRSTEVLSRSLGGALLQATRGIAYDDLLALGEEAAGEVEIALRAGARDIGLRLEGIDEIRFWPEVYPEGYDPAAAAGRRVLLVGLDGAEWRILDPLFERGLLPNLERIVREGARARLRTIAPVLSPIIWTSAATGKRPEKHGIVDFLAVDSRTGRQIPVTSTMRTARAFWEILSARGISVGTVAWWATWPAQPVLGFQVSDRVAYQLFGQSGSGEGLRGRTYPEGLILSLAPLVAAAEDRAREDILEILGGPASEENQDEQGLLQILTSTRIYHHAALSLIREYGPRVTAVYYEGTDTVAHHFMRYAPPRMPGVTPEEVGRWGAVVERYYVYQDRLLGELLEAAGEGTTVLIVSDHGFMTGASRPQTDPRIGIGAASDWHRKWGVFAASGPGIPAGETLPDLSVLDVTPTLLALLGLPAAEDMDGRVVEELFGETSGAPPAPIATYEGEERWRPPAEPSTAGSDPAAARVEEEMIAKLTALGYIGQTGANAVNNVGITLLQQGRYAEAEEAFRRAASQDPGFLAARVNLGRALMAQGEMDKALAEFRGVRAEDPGLPDLDNLIGNVHMERGDLERAERTFRDALERDPGNPHLWNSLGIVLSRIGRSGEALAAYRRVVEIDADYAEAINNIGLLFREQGRFEEAIEEFEAAIRADPDFPGSYNNLGLAYQDMGKNESALEAYAGGLEVDPDNAIILNNRGSALLALGRTEEAKEAFSAAVQADEMYAAAHNNLGAALGMLGDLEGEFEQYLRAIELDPEYLDARFNLALNLKRQGRPLEEERCLRQLLLLAPDHARALHQMGLRVAERGDLEEAGRLFARARDAVPRWTAPRNALVQVLLARGRKGEALREAEASLALDPNQDELRRLAERLAGSTSGSTP